MKVQTRNFSTKLSNPFEMIVCLVDKEGTSDGYACLPNWLCQ